MGYRGGTTVIALGLAAVLASQLWMLLDSPIASTDTDAGLLALLGTLTALAGGVIVVLARRRRRS